MVFSAAVFVCLVAVVHCNNDNLLAVVQIFRHGQRTPTSFLNSDPYSNIEDYWGGLGPGQLTNVGKRQHFALGQYSRQRYADWLPAKYSEADIRVETTDIDRTHMSAQANLYGLYPATDSDVWKKNIDWQPIPIHPSDPRVVGSYNCSAYNTLKNAVDSEQEYKDIDETYASVYEYIGNKLNTTISSYKDAGSLYDSWFIEQDVGYTLPSWSPLVYPQPLTFLATKNFESYSYTTQLKRLYSGVLLNTILEYFQKMAQDPTSSYKYHVYSCHDTNVFALLNTFNNTPTQPVPFAVSLWFELRKVNFVNVVQLWMKSGDTLSQLSINGCALNCPLSKLKTLWKDYLLTAEEYEKECST